MLLLDLHYSSHHTQPHSVIVQYVKYLWLNKVLNRRGELWTCFRHVKASASRWSRANHYIIHDIFTIWMRSTLTVETQLLSNEKFGNRSWENVPLNLNLLVSIFFIFVSIFSFSHGNLLKKFGLLNPLSFPLQCILFRSSFPLPLFINSVPICFTTFFQKRQTKINATMRLQLLMYSYRAQVTWLFVTLGAFRATTGTRTS